jgi:hypothetical protein
MKVSIKAPRLWLHFKSRTWCAIKDDNRVERGDVLRGVSGGRREPEVSLLPFLSSLPCVPSGSRPQRLERRIEEKGKLKKKATDLASRSE